MFHHGKGCGWGRVNCYWCVLNKKMATWLSGGLNQFSNITGQITSFTKEVLTETTEEVTGKSRIGNQASYMTINCHNGGLEQDSQCVDL